MHIEEFFDAVPLERLEREWIGQEVAIELLIIDNSAEQLTSDEGRFLERYPSHRPVPEVLRDFTAMHYTPLLEVWNKGWAGLEQRPELGLEDVLSPAIHVAGFTTKITGLKLTTVQRDTSAELELVEIENEAGIKLAFPLKPLVHSAEGVLAMSVADNSYTHRREYAIRLYNLALVISLPLDE